MTNTSLFSIEHHRVLKAKVIKIKMKAVVNVELSYETRTATPGLNIVQYVDPSNYVGFRKTVHATLP
jgi:hypothetical protein